MDACYNHNHYQFQFLLDCLIVCPASPSLPFHSFVHLLKDSFVEENLLTSLEFKKNHSLMVLLLFELALIQTWRQLVVLVWTEAQTNKTSMTENMEIFEWVDVCLSPWTEK